MIDSYAQKFRDEIASLPPLEPDGTFWTDKRIELRAHVLRDNPNDFLTWPTIQQTMYVGWGSSYIKQEFDLVKKWFGFSELDPNQVHTTHHLAAWEMVTGHRVANQRSILEFGAGYGAMGVCLQRCGFSGKYYIYDFPEFELLQQFYLSRHGIDAMIVDGRSSHDLIIANWSLTEAPLKVRDRFLSSHGAKHYLIAFMVEWGGVDNASWVRDHPALKGCRIVQSPAPNSFYAVK